MFSKRKKSKLNDFSNVNTDANLETRLRNSAEKNNQENKPIIQTSPGVKVSGKPPALGIKFGTTPNKLSSLQ